MGRSGDLSFPKLLPVLTSYSGFWGWAIILQYLERTDIVSVAQTATPLIVYIYNISPIWISVTLTIFCL